VMRTLRPLEVASDMVGSGILRLSGAALGAGFSCLRS
jgi:hypothetical protein